MITFTGKGAFGGYAMGQILFYNRIQTGIKAHTVDDPISELERFFAAQKRKRCCSLPCQHRKRLTRSPDGLPRAAEERNCAVMPVPDLDMILRFA